MVCHVSKKGNSGSHLEVFGTLNYEEKVERENEFEQSGTNKEYKNGRTLWRGRDNNSLKIEPRRLIKYGDGQPIVSNETQERASLPRKKNGLKEFLLMMIVLQQIEIHFLSFFFTLRYQENLLFFFEGRMFSEAVVS